MQLRLEMSVMGVRPYPLDSERRRRVMIALAEKDMTISTLANQLGLSRSLISNIISGRRYSNKTEQRIADFLKKEADDLFPRRNAQEIAAMRKAEAARKRNAA